MRASINVQLGFYYVVNYSIHIVIYALCLWFGHYSFNCLMSREMVYGLRKRRIRHEESCRERLKREAQRKAEGSNER